VQLTGQRFDRLFAGIDLAARLHECLGAALAHQQRLAVAADQERGGDTDSGWHGQNHLECKDTMIP